jgi:hypothetical protein
VRAEAYQVVDAALLTFDNRQIATRSDFNVGSEVSLYPFIPGWDFTYGVTVRAARGSAMDPVIAVYDADTGARLAVHDDLGTTDRETLLLGGLPAGVYYVDVYGYDGAYNPRYTLTSNVRAANARAPIAADRFEVNNTRARATRLGQIVAASEVAGLTLTRTASTSIPSRCSPRGPRRATWWCRSRTPSATSTWRYSTRPAASSGRPTASG